MIRIQESGYHVAGNKKVDCQLRQAAPALFRNHADLAEVDTCQYLQDNDSLHVAQVALMFLGYFS